MQVLFLQSHSTCFGRQAPIIRSIKKTGTAAPGTGVIVAGRLHQVGVLFDFLYSYIKHIILLYVYLLFPMYKCRFSIFITTEIIEYLIMYLFIFVLIFI